MRVDSDFQAYTFAIVFNCGTNFCSGLNIREATCLILY